jgi:hypothetical protein
MRQITRHLDEGHACALHVGILDIAQQNFAQKALHLLCDASAA